MGAAIRYNMKITALILLICVIVNVNCIRNGKFSFGEKVNLHPDVGLNIVSSLDFT